ncbi:hypothetical protein McanCB56680_005637 [Microsporum canis]|uniref:HNH nuclease domain-containing protein n=1 Tax=Arthroderma otae (strain ATCC MYA-4605 / CBS 113480) TaxID=554155 RepID=C5FQD6_ARTOC|nr:uncharacterized protein MCYG_04908 [Microsporum canis CBS 113480]EEQ32089.1 predicted protein [Microsporum canis CBS 113480]
MEPEIPPRVSSKLPLLRHKYSTILPQNQQERLEKKYSRVVGTASNASRSSIETSVSEFLERKIDALTAGLDYYEEYQNGLRSALNRKDLTEEDYRNELITLDKQYTPAIRELKIIKRQFRTIEADVEEEREVDLKRQKCAKDANLDFLERAYTATMVTRVMGASSLKSSSSFSQKEFRKGVIKYLGAKNDSEGTERAWCHITGMWHDSDNIKAAHIVPKALRGDELKHLFGVGEVVLEDPRNGITLWKTLEKGLDNGTIAIIPVPSTNECEPTKWKCVLVDQSLRNQTWAYSFGVVHKWEELDGKELTFLTDNRPARRYLYFRFVVTYLYAKKRGNIQWAENIESRKVLWASMGPYLAKSTLISLGRSISGFDLPAALVEGKTFDCPSPTPAPEEELALSASLRTAMIESVRATEDEDEDEDEGEDSNIEDEE